MLQLRLSKQPSTGARISHLANSFNNDRSIEDARVIDGPVAQLQIVNNPPKRNGMQELEQAFQQVSFLEEPTDEELDVSLKRPIKLNKSITPDVS